MRPSFQALGSDRLDRSWISREVGVRGEQHDPFDQRRLLEPIGNIPPAEAEDRYYAMLNEQKLAG